MPTRNDVLNIRFINPKVKKQIKAYCEKHRISYAKWIEIAYNTLTNDSRK
jgi:hypothetical protein